MVLTFFYKVLIVAIVVTATAASIAYLIYRLFGAERLRRHTLENRVDIADLFISLEFMIKTEIDLYESYLKNNTTTDLTTINNTEFTNIYKDLSMKCLQAPSPQFWSLVEVYMNRESVQTYITQRVFDYLAEKVKE